MIIAAIEGLSSEDDGCKYEYFQLQPDDGPHILLALLSRFYFHPEHDNWWWETDRETESLVCDSGELGLIHPYLDLDHADHG